MLIVRSSCSKPARHFGFARELSQDAQSQSETKDLGLWTVSLNENDGTFSPQPFLETPFRERDAAFSPAGRWLAYMSDESGRW